MGDFCHAGGVNHLRKGVKAKIEPFRTVGGHFAFPALDLQPPVKSLLPGLLPKPEGAVQPLGKKPTQAADHQPHGEVVEGGAEGDGQRQAQFVFGQKSEQQGQPAGDTGSQIEKKREFVFHRQM